MIEHKLMPEIVDRTCYGCMYCPAVDKNYIRTIRCTCELPTDIKRCEEFDSVYIPDTEAGLRDYVTLKTKYKLGVK